MESRTPSRDPGLTSPLDSCCVGISGLLRTAGEAPVFPDRITPIPEDSPRETKEFFLGVFCDSSGLLFVFTTLLALNCKRFS